MIYTKTNERILPKSSETMFIQGKRGDLGRNEENLEICELNVEERRAIDGHQVYSAFKK